MGCAVYDDRFSHVMPPSLERKRPASVGDDSMVAYTTSGSFGDTASPMRPSGVVGTPVVILRHVFPASMERQSALSGPPSMSVKK